MFISLKEAKQILRIQAGFSIAAASAEIARLPKRRDGKREKVKSADVMHVVAEAHQPTASPAPRADAFRISAKRVERVRARAAIR